MYITVLGLYLCSLSIGMVLSWTSSALPSILASGRKLRKDVVGVDVQSWIKSAPFLTCIVGGLLAGKKTVTLQQSIILTVRQAFFPAFLGEGSAQFYRLSSCASDG